MDGGSLGDLVENVYELALEPEQWPRLLARLAESFDAHAGAITQENMESGAGAGLAMGLDAATPQLYFGYYSTCNVLRRLDNARERMKGFVPTITIDEETMPKRELMESEFYVDFLRPAGIHSVMTIGLWAHDVDFAGIDLFRPLGRASFTPADAELAGVAHPHLIRAFRLGQRFAELQDLSAGFAAALDRSAYGLFVLTADGRLRHVNGAAERLLAQPGGLRLAGGRLVAPVPDDSNRLEALIAAAGGAAGPRTGGSMALRRGGERGPLSVVVTPTGDKTFSLFHSGPGIIICITDPDAAANVSEAMLCELFGLTGAQSRVAASLLEGRSARETAEALGISFFTVRAHLARIFEKTGAHRQAELVALMMRALGAPIA